MNDSIACLEPSQLRSLLTGDLPPDEIATAESHLSSCDACQQRIEAQVGAEEFWGDVCHSLNEPSDNVGADAGERNPMGSLLDMLGPSDDPAMLGRIGTYEIAGILGTGGMGVVFKGFDRALNRYVAIKMLLPHLAVSGAARKRFAREAQAAAAVVDDHVMAIHSVSQWQGVPYFVMNYSRGISLQKRLRDDGPLELCEILRIGMQAAKGLAAAHAQGLVHRDVKPANIFLDEGVERVQLMDFGLARAADDASLTRSGMLAGTPQFMSPEQSRAEKVDQKSDLFSLGSVMYAMCTGRVPFRAESSYAVLRQITDNAPRPIRQINTSIPEWLCDVIDRLMAKDAGDRFESAAEVADLLEHCIAHVQQPDEIALPAEVIPQVVASDKRGFGNWKWIAAVCFGGLIALAMFAAAKVNPPDITGVWTGEDWGDVALIQTESGAYAGGYSGAAKRGPGTIDVKWSRREKRYVGQWQADAGELGGSLSVRLLDKEIRGAWTKRRRQNGGSPGKLADLAWTRSQTPASPTPFTEIRTNFSRLHKALSGYYADHETFPPSVIQTEGKPPHSWRVALLPYLGEQALYDSYHFDEPWDSEHNRTLLARMPKAYRSPLDKKDSTNASYFGMVNQHRHVIPFTEYEKTDSDIRYWTPQEKAVPIGLSFFGKNEGVPISYMHDGPANIIALVEARQPIPWTKPKDLDFNFDDPSSIKEIPTWFRDGWYVAYGDGRVDFLRSMLKPTQLRDLFSTWESPHSGFTLREYRKHGSDGSRERSQRLVAPPVPEQGNPGAAINVVRLLGLIGEPEPKASMLQITKHMSHNFETGFRITGVVKGSPAAEANLQTEDILLGIERWETGSVEDIGYIVNHMQLQKIEDPRHYIVRDGSRYYGRFDLSSVSMEQDRPTSQSLFQGQSLDAWQGRFVNEVDPQAKIEAAIAIVSMTDHLSDKEKVSKIIGTGRTIMIGGWLTDERLRKQAFNNACEPSQINAPGWTATADLTQTNEAWKRLLIVSSAKLSAVPVDLLADELVKAATTGDAAKTALVVNLFQQAAIGTVICSDPEATKLIVDDLRRDDDVWLSRALFRIRAGFSFGNELHRRTLKNDLELMATKLADSNGHSSDFAIADECFNLAAEFRREPAEKQPRNLGEFVTVMLLTSPHNSVQEKFNHPWYVEPEFVYSQDLLKRSKDRLGWFWNDWMRSVIRTLENQTNFESLNATNTVIETLQPMLRRRDRTDSWNVEAVADLLDQRMQANLVSDFQDDPETPIQTQADLLSLVLLCGTGLPEIAREKPRNPKDNDRLAQLKTLAAEAVDLHHVKREASTIRGLVEVAPYHTIKTIIELGRLPDQTSAIALIDLASQVNRKTQHNHDPSPSLDPILLLAILSDLTGASEEQDIRIGRLFLPSNETESRFFYRHIEDAIQTEFAVRDIAIELLQQMRARTKSDALRTQLRKLLPPSKADTNLP